MLKQAAKLLEGAVAKLQTENTQLRLELALRDGKAQPLEQTKILEEELAKLKAMCFAPSSERRHSDEAEQTPKGSASQGAKTKSDHGPTEQPRLPIQETIYEIAADDATCDGCGKPLLPKKGLVQESELITVVGIELKLEKVTQLVYGCDCPDKLVTAPGPDRVIPGGRYSLELAAFVAAQKYLEHAPWPGSSE